MIQMIPSQELTQGRFSSMYRKNFSPNFCLRAVSQNHSSPIQDLWHVYIKHIELQIFYFFIHSNLDMWLLAVFITSYNSQGHFLVSCGSKYPKYPFFCLRKRCAYLGVPPKMQKKCLEFIISVKVSRQSFQGFSRPILDMIKMTTLSLSVGISLRKRELSLQTVTLQVVLKFSRDRLMRKPASQGENHSYCFLCGQMAFEMLVRV